MDSSHYKILSQDPNISVFAVNKHIAENLEFIAKRSSIEFKEQINIGKFGFIFKADSPQSTDVAVKIISESDVGVYELAWQSFNNKCVIKLLQTHVYREINTRLFVMQRAEYTLDTRIRDEDFTKRSDCFDIVSSWINDLINGIQYIHAKGYAHCSLKKENILILEDNRAVLSHFHSLAPVNSFVKCEEIDVNFRPPECFRNGIERRPIGGSLDIYSLGILVIEVITGDYLGLKLPSRITCWSMDIYPVLFKMTCNLTKMSKEKYPNAENRKLNSARNFICACLGLDPEERAKVSKLWKHQFVGGVELFPENNIWRYKANKNKLRKIVKNMKISQEVNHPYIAHKSMSFEDKQKSSREKWQKAVNTEESQNKENDSNIKFLHKLKNPTEAKSLYKDERMNLTQECAHMQGEHGEYFDTGSESSFLAEEIKKELGAHSHFKRKEFGNMNGVINHEAHKVKVHKEKEKVQSNVEMFMPSKGADLNDIKKNEKIPWNRNPYVEIVDQEISETSLLPKEDEFQGKSCEDASESCKNVTFRQLMKYTFRDGLVYKISHPDNFLNKLSTRLTHNERKRDAIKNIEKDVFCEKVVDEDSSKMEIETGTFSDSLKTIPLKMLDVLLTHLC